ncbi:protein kinase [Nannocystis sp. RBIL2]|uniref:protein kinase domain-containing protein n=1 Tax=Nannocystis sp. RBIL2 TaxID=2996788 RepID=UPI0022714542|nr:protein kinase [Nannocystis sp. RBIL2]MCY1066745.1 protein kinase [Nannocystis sp. RBIL2]
MESALSSPSQPTVDIDDAPGPLTSDSIAGRYQVIRELGVGGMGVVHLAYDKTAARNVALKRMRSVGSGFRERFRREYRALAAVRHTGVPAIYDIGEDGGPFFTMEMIAGETIRDLLRRGPLKPERAVALAIELGRVLMAVHAVGVIHRDVKPSNIIVEDGDRVRLIDFGACLLTSEYYKLPHLRDVTAAGKRWHTSEHEYIGCAPYTCPQYWSEGLVAPQSDVFSVCVVLYEMLTGRALYSEAGGFRRISADEFPPNLAPLVAELERGLAEADERHATMADLVRALEIVRSRMLAPPRLRSVAASAASFLLGVGTAVLILAGESWRAAEATADDAAMSAEAAGPASRLFDARRGGEDQAARSPGKGDADATSVDGVSIDAVPRIDAMPGAEAAPDAVRDAQAMPGAEARSGADATPSAGAKLGAEATPGVGATISTATRDTAKKRRAVPLSWDERLRKAEARARRCFEDGGLALSPRLTTIAAGAPARVRGVASDSAEARCIRDALDRFELRVAEGQRQHTFFAE